MSDAMLLAYRHDAHKFTGESHNNARETFSGVRVNQPVPQGADSDAAALSRPQSVQKPTVSTHVDNTRLSLLTGETAYSPETFPQAAVKREVAELLTIKDAETAHEQWLTSDVATLFSESVYHPYTSLKYHTLLVAALLDNYRAGHTFSDLRLVVDLAGDVFPFRTVFHGERFALRLDANDGGRPSSRLGNRPWQSWASSWNRLTAHPLETDRDKYDMTLDANLRRIWSWSTALQYIEEFASWRPDR
ncbi:MULTISPECIES: hypothetical protein [Haloferax]|uniref:DUF8168 domain-containing protein n=1 Tax=Haloferax marinum TaxID=2666143 RepID=A0A6A8G809_9EURY|nr:hypothetical protein [Haloferax sp. CBA1150]KAB1198194.1 hypothetical protein Hfx1150_11985 [Haloferax sp. CBA1150]MRW97279.1 hypothetical protein [Haloferax marinum]